MWACLFISFFKCNIFICNCKYIYLYTYIMYLVYLLYISRVVTHLMHIILFYVLVLRIFITLKYQDKHPSPLAVRGGGQKKHFGFMGFNTLAAVLQCRPLLTLIHIHTKGCLSVYRNGAWAWTFCIRWFMLLLLFFYSFLNLWCNYFTFCSVFPFISFVLVLYIIQLCFEYANL